MTIPDPTTTRVAPALADPAGLARAPWARATYEGLAQVTVGWLWTVVVGLPVFVLVVVATSLVPALGLGLLLLPLALGLARGVASVERSRLAAQTGVRIPAPPRRQPSGPGRRARLWAHLADGRSWLAALYLLVAALAYAVLFVLVVGAGAGALAAVLLGVRSLVGGDLAGLVAFVVAVLLVWAAAICAQFFNLATVLLARALLGPSADAEARAAREAARTAQAQARAAQDDAATARQRADVLTATRAAALEAADAERRRIERDLHDGVQQRLVALGVTLGTARREADRDPAAAVAALDHAHGEVKESLAELRDLVRGIHPAVLADRGLDAALSALAARSPVPVRVETGPRLDRAGTTAQAAAYFVVAEALTNVARHADADQVTVRADVLDDDAAPRLRVEVADDGRGGAEPAPGSGLAGLRGRVAALDGTFDLTSPTGAGTRLTVEVPCAS